MNRVLQEGFTLVEMLVVLAILALVSAVVWPNAVRSGLQEASISTATLIERYLQDAKSRARLTNKVVSVRIDMKKRSLAVDGRADRLDLPPDVNITTVSGRMAPGDLTAVFKFFPTGESSGGYIAIESRGHRETLSLRWLTGEVRRQNDTLQ